AQYDLRTIVYLGAYHYTARIIHRNAVWDYDGQHNNGRLSMSSAQITDLSALQSMGGRRAHIFLYA
ncbi:hypothetical protein DFP72DRAFT_743230, partial [Ephemerocybe angulata]